MKPEKREVALKMLQFLYPAYKSGSREVFLRAMESQEFKSILIEGLKELAQPTAEQLAELERRGKEAAQLIGNQKKFGSEPVKFADVVKLFLLPVVFTGGFMLGRRRRKGKQLPEGASN